jgi:COPII coat assembly protein SEC16
VDTFSKGGASGAMPSYNKPAAPSVAPPAGAKFFMPTVAAVSADQMLQQGQAAEIQSETIHHDECSASPPAETSFSSPLPSTQFSAPMSSTIHRHPSMDNISTPYQGSGVSSGSNSSSFFRSRAASWSGTYSEQFSATAGTRSPDGQAMPLPLMSGRPSHSRSNSNSSVQFNGLTENLHEVEL